MYLVHNRSDFLSKFLTLFFHHLCFSENGKSLQVLNLEGCCGLGLWSLMYPGSSQIITKCTELVEVNFGSTGLSYDSIRFLADNLTQKVTFWSNFIFSSDAAILRMPKK